MKEYTKGKLGTYDGEGIYSYVRDETLVKKLLECFEEK
jgi:hypothetical protein